MAIARSKKGGRIMAAFSETGADYKIF